MTPAAILFDFDGTILDTEWPVFSSIQQEFHLVGLEFPIEAWQEIVGTDGELDWLGDLRRHLGDAFDEDEIDTRRRAVRDKMLHADGLRPGVRAVLDVAVGRGLQLAGASSSPTRWVHPHLRRIGLWETFHAVRTRDDVERAKPHPDLFLAAADALGVAPADCVAIEDSAHGCTSAKAAGVRVIAAPNRMTEVGDFSHADLLVDDLSDPRVFEFLGFP